MTLNPAYDVIGKGFVQQYYALFDDPAQRPQLVNMYNVSIALTLPWLEPFGSTNTNLLLIT